MLNEQKYNLIDATLNILIAIDNLSDEILTKIENNVKELAISVPDETNNEKLMRKLEIALNSGTEFIQSHATDIASDITNDLRVENADRLLRILSVVTRKLPDEQKSTFREKLKKEMQLD